MFELDIKDLNTKILYIIKSKLPSLNKLKTYNILEVQG